MRELATALADRYRVERELGAGGMATVWLAEDLRHGRRVAIKVLHPELSAVLGPERFLAEIRTTANLQHPHILPLFDSGEADGQLYYVMPFVDGETLRARLERERQLPVDEAVRIAREVADALQYAHERGVIHRDVKPENILLQGGHALVADFGIALAVSNAGGQRVTQTGLSLGTPQYMSPEQAMGEKSIDARTDVYALGAVTYEMLAGEPPFSAPTAQGVIARLLTEEPRRLATVRRAVPPHVDDAVARALEKLPADRWASARELGEALSGTGVAASAPTRATRARPTSRAALLASPRTAWVVAAVACLAAVGAGVVAWRASRASAGDRSAVHARFTLTFPSSIQFSSVHARHLVTISPDAQRIAFIARTPGRRVFVREVDGLEPREIATKSADIRDATFSPDGTELAFLSQGSLRRIALSGGPETLVADSVHDYSWGDGNVVVFTRDPDLEGPLYTVSADGGPVRPLTRVDSARGERGHMAPYVLPGGTHALFTIRTSDDLAESEIAVVRLSDGAVTRLGLKGMRPKWLTGGFVVFASADGTVFAAPFDLEALRVTGRAVAVLEPVLLKQGGVVELAISANGDLVYIPAGVAERVLDVVDRAGRAVPFRANVAGYSTPRFSPDGRRVAMSIEVGNGADIWIADRFGPATIRLTRGGNNIRPAWTADGSRIGWRSGRPPVRDFYWQRADGRDTAALLLRGANQLAFGGTGRFLAVERDVGQVQRDIDLVSLDSLTRPIPFVSTRDDEVMPRFSPDGRWIAYMSNAEVFVRPVPGNGAAVQVSAAGGLEPVWNASGTAIYYKHRLGNDSSQMVMATLATSPDLHVVRWDTLFVGPYAISGDTQMYDVAPDERSFVMVRRVGAGPAPVVVLGWADDVRRKVRGGT